MMKNSKLYKYLAFASVILLTIGYTGCKKYDDPAPVYEELKDLTVSQRKILIIGIDGLGGKDLKEIAPTNLATMQKNSKFSYNTIGGTTDAGGWATIVTGTNTSKNKISTDAFTPIYDPFSNEHDNIARYRDLLDFTTQYRSVKTATITPWTNLRKYLAISEFSPKVSTDLAVKDSTVKLLNTESKLGAVIVNFRDVEAAGNANQFGASNVAYANSVKTTDGYIGEIMTALKARKTYAKEEWLVIVTTNHGGSQASPTKGFVLVYNPLFKEKELKQNGFSTVDFKGPDVVAAVPNDNGLYNMGADKDFTVQMQTKFINDGAYYPKFLGKSTKLDGGTLTGWFWMQAGQAWLLQFGGSANGGGGKNQLPIDLPVLTTDWRTLTMTVKYVNSGSRIVSAFVDGALKGTYNVSGQKNINTNELLKIGGEGTEFYAANLSIFNIALDATTVAANINLKDITQHPNFGNLIGFWPIDEAAGSILTNKAPGGYNMALTGPYKWDSLGDNIPAGTPVDLTYVSGDPSYVSSLTDVTAMSLYWMGIKILPDYGIDGNTILGDFEIDFLK